MARLPASVNECFDSEQLRQVSDCRVRLTSHCLPGGSAICSLPANVNGPSYSRRARIALVLSSDSLGAALVGAATELAGFRVAYSTEGESIPDCIRRVKPLVVLVDADDAIANDAASLGPALMTGASVVFYGRAERVRDVRAVASAAHASVIIFPDEITRLPGILTAIAVKGPGRIRSE